VFEIRKESLDRIVMAGRCHTGQVERMREVFDTVSTSCTVDFATLDYISSAGLGVLLSVQKRLGASGAALSLQNLNDHIREVFRITGFDGLFDIR